MTWQLAPLGEVLTPIQTWNPRRASSSEVFDYIDLSSVDRDEKAIMAPTPTIPSEAPSRARQLVKSGDILVSTVRPNLNAVAVVEEDLHGATASTGFSVLRPDEKRAVSRYIYHWVRTPSFVADMVRKATGASYPAVSDKIVAESLFPLPPLEEQRRIAGILDAADALRRRRREALALLDTLPGAIFAEMFGVLMTSNRFPRGPLRNLIAGFDTGKNLAPASDEAGTRYRVLKVSAVTKGEFIESESKPLPAEYTPPASHFVKPGDLLFSRANTSSLIGATAMVEKVSNNIVLPDKIWRFCVNEAKAEPIFLHYLFGTRKFRDEVSQRATGSSGSMKNISKEKVLSIEVGQPPVEMQREFSRRIRIARGMRTQVTEHLSELENLFASLQSRAFAGEL
ncbi:restriction endonuclease subunit S [Salipiger sp. H15]|uniref:Restriction endonuclease subunit S n=1 Tax=Alloyangia sp. H15 TaxID=3029062 RepID=A0AAU8AGG6_9RHOB